MMTQILYSSVKEAAKEGYFLDSEDVAELHGSTEGFRFCTGANNVTQGALSETVRTTEDCPFQIHHFGFHPSWKLPHTQDPGRPTQMRGRINI